MARFRLARPARDDLANILSISRERRGEESERGYAALLVTAMRQIAGDPTGPLTQNRHDVRSGVRSFPLRHARGSAGARKVKRPVHIVYYRIAKDSVIEILRVLHERMAPTRHLQDLPKNGAD
jgi:toxin ParE1/3/4